MMFASHCLAGCLALAAVSTGLAETLDRIAVSVGQDVITESKVILDLRVAAFLEGKPLDLSTPARRKSAERLVDQLLILREAVDSHVTRLRSKRPPDWCALCSRERLPGEPRALRDRGARPGRAPACGTAHPDLHRPAVSARRPGFPGRYQELLRQISSAAQHDRRSAAVF